MSTDDRLVYMANQIAGAFAQRSPSEAVVAVWDHLWHFWDPRMRERIVAHVAAGGAGLNDVAKAAVARLASGDSPIAQTPATVFASERGAEPGSDAG